MLQSSDEDSLVGMGANANKPNVLSKILSIDPITKITIGLGVVLMLNSLILAGISTRKYKKESVSKIEDYVESINKNDDSEKSKKDIRETIDSLIDKKGINDNSVENTNENVQQSNTATDSQ
jgi:preprotein translocase subunit SecG